MKFEFATATRILFGAGKLREIRDIVSEFGLRMLVVVGSQPERAERLLNMLSRRYSVSVFSVSGEPTIEMVLRGVEQVRASEAQMVISFGGGSVIDAGKAIAALATNTGDPLDYLEVIGQGKPLTQAPLPFIAIPTTAGTGAEVTRNAVLASPEHRVKVSLRHALMLPRVALVDPRLTTFLPPAITASTGMDALTQVLEPYVSHAANPITDAFCQDGLRRGGRALRRVYDNGEDLNARTQMSLTSLLGGLALANAKLGAVHGFTGVLGGMFPAPHGAICAALFAPVMEVNLRALQARDPQNPARRKYEAAARLLTGSDKATTDDLLRWSQDLVRDLGIPSLSSYGVQKSDFPVIVEKSKNSSSMKGNPIVLTDEELTEILEKAF